MLSITIYLYRYASFETAGDSANAMRAKAYALIIADRVINRISAKAKLCGKVK